MKYNSFNVQNRAKGENCALLCTYDFISGASANIKSD
jgi:hypothetical protein